jgi:hypothetical protein
MLNGILQPGETCTYTVDFVPRAHIAYAGNATFSDNDYYLYYPYFAQEMIPLSGLGFTGDAMRATMRITPDSVKAGLGVSMAITVADTSVSSAAPAGDVTVNDTVGSTTTTLNEGGPITLNH